MRDKEINWNTKSQKSNETVGVPSGQAVYKYILDMIISMSTISKSAPFKAQIVAAMNQVEKEFRSSPAYGRLPDKAEDVKSRRKADAGI